VADWATHEPFGPGEKVYLFTGSAGNALEFLVRRATAGAHVLTLRPPLSVDSLTTIMGFPGQLQIILVRQIEDCSEADWALLDRYLAPAKVRGQSLVLVGEKAVPAGPEVKSVLARIRRQGRTVDVNDPTGPAGRAALEAWVEKEWRTSHQVANAACVRADYSVETLVWAWRTWWTITKGSLFTGSIALRLVERIVPQTPADTAYRALLERRPVRRLSLAPEETLGLLRRLESALSDLALIAPVLSVGATPRTVVNRTGVHVVRVMDLSPLVARYPEAAIYKCRQALAFGFAYWRHPEVATVVANLWV
jgi:hypothetical protein